MQSKWRAGHLSWSVTLRVQQAGLTALCRVKGDQATTCLFLLSLNLRSPSYEMRSVTHTVRLRGMPLLPPCLAIQCAWSTANPGPAGLLLCVFWAKLSVSSLGTNQANRFSDFETENAMLSTLEPIILVVTTLN